MAIQLPPLPTNWQEFRAKLAEEVVRAENWRAPYGEDHLLSVMYKSPDYIKGGIDALNGVIATIDAIVEATR